MATCTLFNTVNTSREKGIVMATPINIKVIIAQVLNVELMYIDDLATFKNFKEYECGLNTMS